MSGTDKNLESALRQLEVTYLSGDGEPINRSHAVAVRRRILDLQGRIINERIRNKLSR